MRSPGENGKEKGLETVTNLIVSLDLKVIHDLPEIRSN